MTTMLKMLNGVVSATSEDGETTLLYVKAIVIQVDAPDRTGRLLYIQDKLSMD